MKLQFILVETISVEGLKKVVAVVSVVVTVLFLLFLLLFYFGSVLTKIIVCH
jgi:hypothetical protein